MKKLTPAQYRRVEADLKALSAKAKLTPKEANLQIDLMGMLAERNQRGMPPKEMRKWADELPDADPREVGRLLGRNEVLYRQSRRNSSNAVKPARIDAVEMEKVRALWAQVCRELKDKGNRERYPRLRGLLSKAKIEHPGKMGFTNWLKSRL